MLIFSTSKARGIEPSAHHRHEDFPLPVAEALRTRGFSVVAAVELPPRGIADIDQLRRAARMGWVLVSHNRRHFIRLGHDFR